MRKKILFIVFALMLSTIAVQIAQAGIIAGVERRNSTNDTPVIAPDPLGEDALCFVDRTHEYNSVPAGLVGVEYIKVANDDKTTALYELDVTLSKDATLYLLLDNRIGNNDLDPLPGDDEWEGVLPDLAGAGMSWVSDLGFADIGVDIGVDEGGDGDIDKWSSVYSAQVPAGTITLYQQNNTGGRNMYGVAAIPEPMTMVLLGLGALGVLRRRK